jgi:hypothetical protein
MEISIPFRFSVFLLLSSGFFGSVRTGGSPSVHYDDFHQIVPSVTFINGNGLESGLSV